MRTQLITKNEVLNRIAKDGSTTKKIAVFADNLKDKVIATKVTECLNYYEDKGIINYHDKWKNISMPNILHNDIRLYTEKIKNQTIYDNNTLAQLSLLLENIILSEIDEVWVFDTGYDNLMPNGRLDNLLIENEIIVRYLYFTSDKTWEFYESRESYYNENEDDFDITYSSIVENMNYNYVEPNKNLSSNKMRILSKDMLSDNEYDLALNALKLTYQASYIQDKGTVRSDYNIFKQGAKLVYDCNKIFFGILCKDKCTDNELKNYNAQIDFITADIDDLMIKNNIY